MRGLRERSSALAIALKLLERTVFENHRKKSHFTLRAKRATFTFCVDFS